MSTPELSNSPPRLGVRERIYTTILSWSDTQDQPPFSATDLIIMAGLSSGCALSRKEICEWLVENFGYYRMLAAEAFWGYNRGKGKLPAVQDVHKMLDKALREYELPVDVIPICDNDEFLDLYRVHPGAEAMLPLTTADDQPDKATLPFFELPAELRNTIYELVFRYPRSGLYFPSLWVKRPRVLSRDLMDDDDFGPARANGESRKKVYRTRPVHEILEPLLTHRQFYREAMPVFFELNCFYFADHYTMSRTLKRMPVVHKEHIKSLDFTLPTVVRDDRIGEELTPLLGLLALRKLCIRFDEETWLNGGPGISAHQSVEQHPGASVLRQLHGLEEVEFVGCPKLQASLGDGMLRRQESGASRESASDSRATKRQMEVALR
ncbi:hypothetical protein LTR97_007339 [Elasticomyces elasticus]|uniref:DUF7730 domain-containing protein n=1 Tax=Elasticomyces elasticus TaxID=574655 RepID=A0AAN7W877_9PEZI|nr:hypothetical protein LTR97_007339 [Elasticomyces elasticus]